MHFTVQCYQVAAGNVRPFLRHVRTQSSSNFHSCKISHTIFEGTTTQNDFWTNEKNVADM